ncbi:hypothetical protein [Mucilaginibacter sp. 44-25]|nr:hypothetical protein [Mucilaginibacter sp. 44-25]
MRRLHCECRIKWDIVISCELDLHGNEVLDELTPLRLINDRTDN